MPMPGFVAFDVDGCLVDTDALHESALNRSLREIAGFELTHEEHLQHFKGLPTSIKLSRLITSNRIGTRDATKVADRKQQLTAAMLADLPPDPSKRELLLALRRASFRLCAVSNALPASVQSMVDHAGVGSLLDFFLSNTDAAPKPSPALYLMAAERMAVEPSDLVVIEDGDLGIASAVRAGCQVVAVNGPSEVGLPLFPRIVEASVRGAIKVAV